MPAGTPQAPLYNQPPIRRKDRTIPYKTFLRLLQEGVYGVLSTSDQEGQPYGVPLSYCLLPEARETIYFHSAKQGCKIDNLRANARACFTVVGRMQAVYDNNFTTTYESAMVFGRVEEIVDAATKRAILLALACKYLPAHMDKADADINAALNRTAVYALHPERISGKGKQLKYAA